MTNSPVRGVLDYDTTRSSDWSAGLVGEAELLQHEVRNMLTPALLSADMLLIHADPMVAQRAEIVIKAITRVINRVG